MPETFVVCGPPNPEFEAMFPCLRINCEQCNAIISVSPEGQRDLKKGAAAICLICGIRSGAITPSAIVPKGAREALMRMMPDREKDIDELLGKFTAEEDEKDIGELLRKFTTEEDGQ